MTAALNNSQPINPTPHRPIETYIDPHFIASPSSPSNVSQKLQQSTTINWKKVATRSLCLFSGVALGALASMAAVGFMTTPVGWGIAAGLLTFGLIGSVACGGPKEFLHALKYAALGFGLGFGLGAMLSASTAAGSVGIAAVGGHIATMYGVGALSFFISVTALSISLLIDLKLTSKNTTIKNN